MNSVIKLCNYEFRIQMKSKKVWLGYLIGIVMILKDYIGYIYYAEDMKEAVNVLDVFLIAGNNPNKIIFYSLGWLLVMSGTPFINNVSSYAIYRTKRKIWNCVILLYIAMQAFIYSFVMVIVTVAVSLKKGYLANVWSCPMIRLSKGMENQYDISFEYPNVMREASVYEVFIHTFLLLLLYIILLGIITYAFSLLLQRKLGPLCGAAFHFLGYEIMKERMGFSITYSLLARSIAAFQIGDGALENISNTYVVFLVGVIVLAEITHLIIKYVDFKEVSMEEES